MRESCLVADLPSLEQFLTIEMIAKWPFYFCGSFMIVLKRFVFPEPHCMIRTLQLKKKTKTKNNNNKLTEGTLT